MLDTVYKKTVLYHSTTQHSVRYSRTGLFDGHYDTLYHLKCAGNVVCTVGIKKTSCRTLNAQLWVKRGHLDVDFMRWIMDQWTGWCFIVAVLKTNKPARVLYTHLGFKKVREGQEIVLYQLQL